MKFSAPRAATKEDAPAIIALLNQYVAESTSTFMLEPQTLEERLQWFEQRSENCPVVAVEAAGSLVAWGALSEHNPRGGYCYTADVSVYVHADFHRCGIGRNIVADLIDRARVLGYHTLIAHCCSESLASIRLHESLGFIRIGQYREVGRKFDRWLDVIALQLML